MAFHFFLYKWSEEFETNKKGKDANKLWIEFKDALIRKNMIII